MKPKKPNKWYCYCCPNKDKCDKKIKECKILDKKDVISFIKKIEKDNPLTAFVLREGLERSQLLCLKKKSKFVFIHKNTIKTGKTADEYGLKRYIESDKDIIDVTADLLSPRIGG